MWNDYFYQIQRKYNMKISSKLPLVVRFDGRAVTRNKDMNLLDRLPDSFLDNLEKTAKYFSKRYRCFAILGADEISFVILEPNLVLEDFEPDTKGQYSQELIAFYSQYFFDYFNHFDTHKKIFWHGKCLSIPEDKVKSYIKYRSTSIKNVLITYFAKRNNINNPSYKLEEKIDLCKTIPGYTEVEEFLDGILYYNGEEISLEKYMSTGEIVRKENIKENNKEVLIDIDNIDIELL